MIINHASLVPTRLFDCRQNEAASLNTSGGSRLRSLSFRRTSSVASTPQQTPKGGITPQRTPKGTITPAATKYKLSADRRTLSFAVKADRKPLSSATGDDDIDLKPAIIFHYASSPASNLAKKTSKRTLKLSLHSPRRGKLQAATPLKSPPCASVRATDERLSSDCKGTLRVACERRGIDTTGFSWKQDFLAALAEHRAKHSAYQLALLEGSVVSTTDASKEAASDARIKVLERFAWLLDQVRSTKQSRHAAAIPEAVPVLEGEPLLRSGQVGGVVVLVLRGKIDFVGDEEKATRNDARYHSSATGDLCTSATLREGDVLAIGLPEDEGMLAVRHGVLTEALGKTAGSAVGKRGRLRLLGGTHHACRVVVSGPETELIFISMEELTSIIADSSGIVDGGVEQEGIAEGGKKDEEPAAQPQGVGDGAPSKATGTSSAPAPAAAVPSSEPLVATRRVSLVERLKSLEEASGVPLPKSPIKRTTVERLSSSASSPPQVSPSGRPRSSRSPHGPLASLERQMSEYKSRGGVNAWASLLEAVKSMLHRDDAPDCVNNERDRYVLSHLEEIAKRICRAVRG